ncbi:phage antirepressor KilAC domain-containing protein [Paenibacillus sp. HWE-109]|nr:phage antirepressor KilAC domain-containing protein [Paenibacillus sp. HWE-109]
MVAETFNKDHKNVLADIENQLNKLNEAGEKQWGLLNFQHTQYQHPQNKQWYPKFNLTEEAFAIVAMAYVTPEAMKMKIRFLGEFKRMRDELNKPQFPLPQSYSEALRLAADLSDKNEQLETEKLMLQQQVKEYEPKVTYLDRILQSKDTVSVTQIAKDYGLSGQQLNQILHEEKVQYKLNGQWLLYQKHQDKGFTKSQTIDVLHNNGERSVKMNTKWSQKGRLFIHELLAKQGIIPSIDREHTLAQ